MIPTDLQIALNAKSIAIVGASETPHRIGGRPLYFLARFGFKGRVYPINPKRTGTQGFRTFPALAALPESPDVAVIAIAGEAAIEALDDCAAARVKIAIVIAAGFGESDPVHRKEKEREMTRRTHTACASSARTRKGGRTSVLAPSRVSPRCSSKSSRLTARSASSARAAR